jgi:hypothetical protein
MPKRPPDLQRLGLPQPAGLVGVERGAALPDRPQRTIDGAPVGPGGWLMRGRPRERRVDLDDCLLGVFPQHDQPPAIVRIAF